MKLRRVQTVVSCTLVKMLITLNTQGFTLLIILHNCINIWHRHYRGMLLYRVIHNSLRDVRPLRYSSRDGHAEGEHINRGRDTPRFCSTLQVLICSFLLCMSWLLRSRVRKFRRDLYITLYFSKSPYCFIQTLIFSL
jgi:hypothetical protein